MSINVRKYRSVAIQTHIDAPIRISRHLMLFWRLSTKFNACQSVTLPYFGYHQTKHRYLFIHNIALT